MTLSAEKTENDVVNQSDQSESHVSQSTAPSSGGFIPQVGGYFRVQTNVDSTDPRVPLTGGRSGVIPMMPSMQNFEADRQNLQNQIEELNKRHQEAQAKLQQFFSQQQQPGQQPQQLQQQTPPPQQVQVCYYTLVFIGISLK